MSTASTSLTPTPSKWRGLFSDCLKALGLEQFGFRPYSLRRGGATWWFSKHHSLERILIQGRWSAVKTARIYLNEGLAMLARTSIDFKQPRLRSYIQVFYGTVKSPTFKALEPSVATERTGGRGRKVRKHTLKKHSGKNAPFYLVTQLVISDLVTRGLARFYPCLRFKPWNLTLGAWPGVRWVFPVGRDSWVTCFLTSVIYILTNLLRRGESKCAWSLCTSGPVLKTT